MGFKSERERDIKGFQFKTEIEILAVLGSKPREREREIFGVLGSGFWVMGYGAMEEIRRDQTRELQRRWEDQTREL